jgi:hypothetical protein
LILLEHGAKGQGIAENIGGWLGIQEGGYFADRFLQAPAHLELESLSLNGYPA